MGKIRRKFDIGFKVQVCERIESGLQSVAEVCRENQLQRPLVEGWLQRYSRGTLIAKTPTRQTELERENEKLRAKIGELTMTIDLLKKMEVWKRQQTNVASSIITSSNLAQFQEPAEKSAWRSRATITNQPKTK